MQKRRLLNVRGNTNNRNTGNLMKTVDKQTAEIGACKSACLYSAGRGSLNSGSVRELTRHCISPNNRNTGKTMKAYSMRAAIKFEPYLHYTSAFCVLAYTADSPHKLSPIGTVLCSYRYGGRNYWLYSVKGALVFDIPFSTRADLRACMIENPAIMHAHGINLAPINK